MNLLPRPRVVETGDALTANRVASERIDAVLPPEGYALRIGEHGVLGKERQR